MIEQRERFLDSVIDVRHKNIMFLFSKSYYYFFIYPKFCELVRMKMINKKVK